MQRFTRAAGRRALLATVVAGMFAAPGLAVASTATPAHPTGHRSNAQQLVVPVDRQDYVTTVTTTNPVDGTTIDPYDADPSSIHVATQGGQEFARSFVHLALGYLPSHALPTDAVMTLHLTQQSDASNTGVFPIYDVNQQSAIIEACALTTELPSKFDSSKPPAYDCQHGSAVGRHNTAADTWTFDLKDLLAYWKVHGNTGAALVPVEAPGATWQVAFYRSRSVAKVAFQAAQPAGHRAHHHHPVAGSTGGGSTSAPSGGAQSTGSGTGNGSTGAPANPPVTGTVPGAGSTTSTGTTPSVAPPVSPTTTPAAAPAPHHRGSATWPWVLLASIVVAGGALGAAHREQVLAALSRLRPVGLAAFRAHPRAYAVASAALAWGLVFSGYSLVVTPSHPAQAAADSSPTTSNAVGGTTTTPGGATTLTPGGHSATSATGGTTVTNGGATSSGGTTTAGSTGSGSTAPQSNPAANEFTGRGTYRTINGVPVFFPANGGPPVAKLYSGADDVAGLSPSSLRICAHAALTYGAAFNIGAKDLDVYWQDVNAHGGIFGRKVVTNYVNDNYDPGTAVQAAQTCKDWGTFLLLGGIGFDQIPAVRQWAEQNHMLYLHHIATIEGSAGLRYSFSALPTVEQVGTWMGQLAVQRFRGLKVGILYRQSSNWTPGVSTFERVLKSAGMHVVGSYGVTINQGNYTQELTQLHTAGAQVVLAWDNALAEIEMIKQAQAQNWHPTWLVNGFNIITNTLGSTALDQQMWSAAEWDAYDPGYYGGGFASYAPQIKEFEREYKQYDPKADLKGDGGDLLFLNWESQKWLHDLLLACGPQCTRNKLAGLMLAGWHKITPPNCAADFNHTADHHHAGFEFNVLHAVRDPNGRANFVPVNRCITGL